MLNIRCKTYFLPDYYWYLSPSLLLGFSSSSSESLSLVATPATSLTALPVSYTLLGTKFALFIFFVILMGLVIGIIGNFITIPEIKSILKGAILASVVASITPLGKIIGEYFVGISG